MLDAVTVRFFLVFFFNDFFLLSLSLFLAGAYFFL
jgi:hypothetical protein